MEGTDGMGYLVPVGHKDKGVRLEQQVLRVHLGHKEKGERQEQQALKVPVGHKDKVEKLEQKALTVPLGQKEKGARLEKQVVRVWLVQGVVVWSTQGGGKLAVQMSQELSWCMEGGLVEPTGNIREAQPTTSACLMIQTTSATVLEFKVTAMCMEQNINHTMANHSRELSTTMFHVLCAMLQRGWQSV